MFNYRKFYAVTHFAQCIRDYGNTINYNIVYSETTHKYLLKAFYNRTNKKKYNAQIQQYNIGHINIITKKDVIISKMSLEKEGQLVIKDVDKIALVEVG